MNTHANTHSPSVIVQAQRAAVTCSCMTVPGREALR